ncbi:MAG: NRDE family protein [Polyangiaceae bacterium]
MASTSSPATRAGLVYTSNCGEGARPIEPGIHGLSNHPLDTPWPKVLRAKARLTSILAATGEGEIDPEPLFRFMRDDEIYPDADLPDTGVGLARERLLSPIFIRMPGYGTRCTTVLLQERTGAWTFIERTHAPDPLPDVRYTFGP